MLSCPNTDGGCACPECHQGLARYSPDPVAYEAALAKIRPRLRVVTMPIPGEVLCDQTMVCPCEQCVIARATPRPRPVIQPWQPRPATPSPQSRVNPRRTHHSTTVFQLDGGNEDTDLWVTRYQSDEGTPALGSTWQLTDTERTQIAAGANVELIVYGDLHPPVCLRLCDTPLGKAP